MLGDPVKKAKSKYNKAVQEIKQFKAKISELEERIKAIEDQNKSLREEAGAILAKINLGESPPESRKEVDQKMQAIEQNKLEIEGLKFAIEELEKRLEAKQEELNKIKVGVYLAFREKLFDLIEKELKRYIELAPQIKEAHQKICDAVNWIERMEIFMQQEGYERDGKEKERLPQIYGDSINRISLPKCDITVPDSSQPGKYKSCLVDLESFWKEKIGLAPAKFDSSSDSAIKEAIYETLMIDKVA